MSKLCVLCKHLKWEWDEGSNCDTCGYDAYGQMTCGKNHWKHLRVDEEFLSDFRGRIVMAETCEDYAPVKTK